MEEFKSRLISDAESIEKCLASLLADKPLAIETTRPARLMQAMRYSALDGGKRIRPFLVIETTRLLGGDVDQATLAGAALELIHCYSLVHDDLPAMDNDDLRRGRPTTHIAYGEASAILAGDALLTLAFDVLAREATHPDPAIRIELVRLYARSSGLGGMAGGQLLDLDAEEKSPGEDDILTLQAMKTGALLRCACEAGAVLGGASGKERKALEQFGRTIGQAFQLADDILDVTSDKETMGKQTGKDIAKGKGTLVELHGLEESRKRASKLLDQAIAALKPFGASASTLCEAARFTIERES